jgi:predicted O-methyltransferase YrrM
MSTTFPDYQTWCDTVLNPADVYPWDFRTKPWHEHYRFKYDLVRHFKPQTILEIGVRFGYSAHAFMMAAPSATYTGIDADKAEYGARPRGWNQPCTPWAYQMLISTTGREPAIIRAEMEGMPLVYERIDFMHVDGDHSYVGCMRDLRYCHAMHGVILVDDYRTDEPVRQAVNDFVIETGRSMFLAHNRSQEVLIL